MKYGLMSPLIATTKMNLLGIGNIVKRDSKLNGLMYQIFFSQIPHTFHLPLVLLIASME